MMKDDFITRLDIFGQGIQLTLNQQEKSKTLLGGVLTLCLFTLLLAMFYFTSLDVFNHTNPFVAVENKILSKYPNITLDRNTFPFSIAFTNETSYNIYLPRYFTYEVLHVHGEMEGTLSQDRLPLDFCRKEDFPNINEEDFDATGTATNLCVKDQNITIGGSWGESFISFISIRLYLCRNDSGECAPREEIEEYISRTNYYLSIYFLNTAMNSQLDNPVAYYYTNFYKSLALDKYKYVDLKIKQNNLTSDDGFIFPTQNKYSSLTMTNYEFDISEISNTRLLLEYRLYASNHAEIIHRSYTKIQTVLAGVGGLANILRIVFILICYVFSTIKRDEMILNQIFDYDLIEKKRKIEINSQLNPKKPIAQTLNPNSKSSINKLLLLKGKNQIDTESKRELIGENPNNRLSTIKLTNVNQVIDGIFAKELNKKKPAVFKSDINCSPRKKMKLDNLDSSHGNSFHLLNLSPEDNERAKRILEAMEKRKKNYRLHFSFCEVFNWFFCFCYTSPLLKQKKQLYKKTINSVNQFIDISNLIQKLEEFEKLKFVIFTSQQLAMFNFIAKDFCSLNTNEKSNNPIHKIKKFSNNREILAKYVLSFNSTGVENRSEVDLKLFNLLNDDIKINFKDEALT